MKQQLKCLLFLVLLFYLHSWLYSANYLIENVAAKFRSDSILSDVDFNYPAKVCTAEKEIQPIHSSKFRKGGIYTSSEGLWIDKISGIIQANQSSPGTYAVSYSISANADTSAGNHIAYITIKKAPEIFVTPSLMVEPNSSIEVFASGASNFTWTPNKNLSCVTCSRTSVYASETMEYCAQSNFDGCMVKACTTISLGCNDNKILQVPNAFSPNGDGNNDFFCLQGWDMCVKNFQFIIFNRLGQIIFESKDTNQCWDGSSNGLTAEPGVYLYVITANYNKDKVVQKKGNINLLR